jgi:hypothetical protein
MQFIRNSGCRQQRQLDETLPSWVTGTLVRLLLTLIADCELSNLFFVPRINVTGCSYCRAVRHGDDARELCAISDVHDFDVTLRRVDRP